MIMSEPLQRVAHLLVTEDNPPRDDIDGMDSERCAALHNAIFEHGWINSGRSAESFQIQTQPFLLEMNTAARQRLHPSLEAFLRQARSLLRNGPDVNLFYFVHGSYMSWDKVDFEYEVENGDDRDPDRLPTLYGVNMWFASKLDGLVYDQLTHKAIMHFDILDDFALEPNQPWRKLEDILSVWIQMIQRGKVKSVPSAQGPADPWIMVPWAAQDLEECLELWGLIITSIEQKMALGTEEPAIGLLDVVTLDSANIPDGFVRNFILQARRPRFQFIAPGLRLPSAEDFGIQPFVSLPKLEYQSPEDTAPILLFRSDEKITTADLSGIGYPWIGPDRPVNDCPCGLYIVGSDSWANTPFEDGCRLVLPFELNQGFAKQGDFGNVQGFDGILQQGVNPYGESHNLPFQAWLETVYLNIQNNTWAVDALGVTGGIDVWRQADTETGWQHYFSPLGPVGYW